MNRVIVITGATGALGALTAQTFAGQGDSLALLDFDQQKLDALTRDLSLPDERLLTLIVDLRDEQAIQSAVEAVSAKFGKISGLIHLVGGWVGGKTLAESPAEDFEFMLGQHAWTTFNLFKHFSSHLAASGWGRVITVSIPFGAIPYGTRGAYAAAKSAQESLVQSLADELRDNGVTANIVHVKAIDVKGEGKGTTPAEIVSTILYLFSDDAGKINGAKIPLY